MNWQNRTLSPQRPTPPKHDSSYPCPALCSAAATAAFVAVGLLAYHLGLTSLGIAPLDWAAPHWTRQHVVVIASALLLSVLAALIAFAATLTVKVRNERLSNLYTVLWQFLSNGSVAWIITIGISMSLALGKSQAQQAVLQYGAERAATLEIVTGCGVGSLQGLVFLWAQIRQPPLCAYLAICGALAALAAHWNLTLYGISSRWWILPGLAYPLLLLGIASARIARDQQQRRLKIEEARAARNL